MQTAVLVPHGLSDIQLTLRSVGYEKRAYLGIEELEPGDEFTGAMIVHNSSCNNEMDRPLELVTDAPSVAPVGGFQDRIAKAAQD